MLSHNVESLLEQRYYQPGETWTDLVNRVVSYVCSDEPVGFKNSVKKQLEDRIWLPNSPCLVNAGLSNSGLMACFVVGPDEDTLEHHVDVLGDIALVGKRGGGAGFSGAAFRPEGSSVAGSAHGYAYGPNQWAIRVSEYLDMISQGGFRRMALMYSLPANHADIYKFIKLKHNGNERFGYNFNQSVFATDEWMKAATNGHLTDESETLVSIADHAHANGEPGLLFDTRINNNTPYTTCGCKISTTNPCGEQPLPSYGSCNLGSINLDHEIFYTNLNNFNFPVLASIVTYMTRFLDNIGTKNVFPNEKFKNWYDQHRPIGIGVMGFADALLRLGYTYGASDSLKFISDVMQVIQGESYRASEKLGQERGIPEHCRAVNRRNITTVSIAPTGSIAFLGECSHSIEPIFSPKYQRTDERGETYIFEHPESSQPHFRSTLNEDKNKIPSWRQHIDIQAAAQKYVDSGVSKTINMLNGVSKKDVYNAFVYAWQKRCKGITIYRDGSRDLQVLEDIKEKDSLIQECPSGVCDL
jgi:ribonucleoside-diphosphate reductase alpha chain